MIEILGEYLDRLITTNMTTGHASVGTRPGDYILNMYKWTREKTNTSLTYLAAKNIVDSVEKDDFVFLMAEAAFPPYLSIGETDGPMGTAALARMFDIAFEAKPVIIASSEKIDASIAVWNAAELEVQPEEIVRNREYGGAVAEPFPIDDEEAKKVALELIDRYNPSALISVETLAVNAKGQIHCVSASNSTPYVMKAHHLINEAKEKGILTIGIADGGNEIGCGNIYDELRSFGGLYADCRPICHCGGGVTTVVETDFLVPAAVSNWGAYGIEACIAAIVDDVDVMHDEIIERRMLEACANVGLAGGIGKRMLNVDGTSLEAGQALITILREMVKNYLKKSRKRAF